MTAHGPRGDLRHGYRVVAHLGLWSVTWRHDICAETRSWLDAIVLQRDAFWSTQGITEIRLLCGAVWWIWQAPVLTFLDGRVRGWVSGLPQ